LAIGTLGLGVDYVYFRPGASEVYCLTNRGSRSWSRPYTLSPQSPDNTGQVTGVNPADFRVTLLVGAIIVTEDEYMLWRVVTEVRHEPSPLHERPHRIIRGTAHKGSFTVLFQPQVNVYLVTLVNYCDCFLPAGMVSHDSGLKISQQDSLIFIRVLHLQFRLQ
jgi:hypothetical protein